MKYVTLIFFLGGLVLNLKGSEVAPGDKGMGFEPGTNLLAYALATAPQIEIYEGLPREMVLNGRPKNTVGCQQITDQWVYSLPQEFRFKHVQKLQRLVGERLFQPWREGKLCAGFHADYVIAVPSAKDTIYVLFCFGCHEARIVREGSAFASDIRTADFRLTTDLNPKNFEELRSLLTGYHQETPPLDPAAGPG